MKHDVVKRTRGFTLIELLVVVAVIGILAAILFPVFARARENARRASCLSNLKQIGLAVMMYTQDYDEKYPKSWMDNSQPRPVFPSSGSTTWFWYQQIYGYVKNTQVFFCPSSSGTTYTSLNYGANELVFTTRGSVSSPVDPLTLSSITSAATTYMLFDAGYYRIDPKYVYNSTSTSYASQAYFIPGEGTGGASCTNWETKAYFSDCQDGRHFDGGNMAFADGHVKWLKASEVVKQAYNKQDGKASAWDPANDN